MVVSDTSLSLPWPATTAAIICDMKALGVRDSVLAATAARLLCMELCLAAVHTLHACKRPTLLMALSSTGHMHQPSGNR